MKASGLFSFDKNLHFQTEYSLSARPKISMDSVLKNKLKIRTGSMAKKSKNRVKSKRRPFRGKAERYWAEADIAYTEKRYKDAFDWAMKGLKLNPKHTSCYYFAWMSANHFEERRSLFTALQHGWRHNLIEMRQHLAVLGSLAYTSGEYGLAKEAYQALIDNPQKLKGDDAELEREILDAEYYVGVCERLEQTRRQRSEKRRSSKASPPSKRSKPAQQQKQKQEEAPEPPEEIEEELPELELHYEIEQDSILTLIQKRHVTNPAQLDLTLTAYQLSFRASYDQLICLPMLHNVESLWYQEETARKVMRTFRGRTILADEVGLGKTVEAGLVLKEYMLRGLVKSALILVPSSLVHQWRDELHEKFDISCATSLDPLFRDDPAEFWQQPLLLVSLQTARMARHFDAVTARSYDMVIVDEAHHLKNRTTRNWKLVNAVQKTFLLLLTATPVQNKLEELYNLVTLLKPGHLKTAKAFKEEFVARGNPTDPRNREKLRELLKEVMIRNTRSVTHLRLPPRFAYTVKVEPAPEEREFYDAISRFVAQQSQHGKKGISKMVLRRLLEAGGSSHAAAVRLLENMQERGEDVLALIAKGKSLKTAAKVERILDVLNSSKDQTIVFVNHLQTVEHLRKIFQKRRIRHIVYQGGLTPAQKKKAIEEFEGGCPVLLSTDTGGEGHNLQFCHTLINYDLPWNPMRIEQRIGRIHRIGQEKEVQVYNFCASGSLEDYILEILDRKINMFELVVGEIDMILGRLQGEQEFEDMVYELWLEHQDAKERKKAFNSLGTRMKRAKTAYQKSQELDDKLFQEDFGI